MLRSSVSIVSYYLETEMLECTVQASKSCQRIVSMDDPPQITVVPWNCTLALCWFQFSLSSIMQKNTGKRHLNVYESNEGSSLNKKHRVRMVVTILGQVCARVQNSQDLVLL
jgi:hypothetical protein